MVKALAPVLFAIATLVSPVVGPPQTGNLTDCHRVAVETEPYGVPSTTMTVCPTPS